MTDQYPREVKESHAPTKPAEEETQGCGVFDFLKKKETEKPHQVQEHHKPTLAEKLHHQSHDGDSSSSSSDEEGGEKKKKGLKGKIKDKISGKREDEEAYQASAPIEKPYDSESGGAPQGEEKKGFMEKIKDKLPGQHKEAEHGAHGEYHAMDGNIHAHETEKVEKKGILEKIKDKLPGGHKNEEEKAKEH